DGIIPPTIGPFNSLERGSGVRSSMSRRRSWAAKGSVGNRDDSAARGRSSSKPTKDIVFGVLGVLDVFGGCDWTPGDSAAGGRAGFVPRLRHRVRDRPYVESSTSFRISSFTARIRISKYSSIGS